MKIAVVIPFCAADAAKVIRLLDWIGELGGCKENSVLFIPAFDVHSGSIDLSLKRLSNLFLSSNVHQPPFRLNDESHPRGPNLMFETACKYALKNFTTPWLWLEPDAVPMRKGWLQMIEAEYDLALRYKKTILAHVTELNDPKYPKRIPCGVAVYPADAWNYYRELSLNRSVAWDIQFADRVMPMVHASRSFADLVNRKNPPTFAGPRALKVENIPSYVAVWHQCKDDSLINALRDKQKAKAQVFYHSGDLGDIIYALPVIMHKGGGDLVLGPDSRVWQKPREKMTQERMDAIAPLLRAQSYISSVTFSETMPAGAIDMNQARHTIRSDHEEKNKASLCESFLKHFGFDKSKTIPKWLTVNPTPLANVVIARSSRYHNPDFDWSSILKRFRNETVFVGLRSEHQAFEKEFGKIAYHHTESLFELAKIIAGSKLFIGNQSCPYALAEGLKVNAILEDYPAIPNCYFERKNVTHGNPKELLKPKKTKLEKKDALIIRGPMDTFSGFGQIVHQIVMGMNRRGQETRIYPTMITDGCQTDVPEISPEYSKLVVQGTNSHVIISMHCGLPNIIQGGEVVMTMWESTRISPETRDAINKSRHLIVPTEWAATSFNACGVDIPISIVPLGVDTSVFKPKKFPEGKPFTFGCAGRVAHGGMRKGMDDVIAAFLKAFPNNEDARLEIKCYVDCKIEVPKDKRIIFNREFLPNLSKWYAGLNVFVSASKGEGWGLQPHQAMACGRPVIASRFSGLSEFFDDSVGWPVKYKLTKATGYYENRGLWAEPDIDDLAKWMRYAFEHHKEVEEKGKHAIIRAKRFSLENMLDGFEKALKEAGMI